MSILVHILPSKSHPWCLSFPKLPHRILSANPVNSIFWILLLTLHLYWLLSMANPSPPHLGCCRNILLLLSLSKMLLCTITIKPNTLHLTSKLLQNLTPAFLSKLMLRPSSLCPSDRSGLSQPYGLCSHFLCLECTAPHHPSHGWFLLNIQISANASSSDVTI